MTRLSTKALAGSSGNYAVPAYNRAKVTPGIVHLGIGAFHRAHMAVYVDDLLAANPSWGIVGASLRRPDTKEALEPQDGLYTIAVRDASGTQVRVIGSILKVMDANTEREDLLALMASPQIRIVSLTVTEKGYCHDPATGKLDRNHPDIVHDLANPTAPRSAPGMIVEGLYRRWQAGTVPFTVMSCDNLPSNGETTQRIITQLALLRDVAFSEWLSEAVSFPSTMIDRIVPSTTDADRALVTELTGLEDAWPIMTEPFTQWVIEDVFEERPPFETVGATMTRHVEQFERMKLRMLNGSHSTMAYLGYLAGYEYIADVMGDPAYVKLIHGLMTEEAAPTLITMRQEDLAAYRDKLLERFRNPALKHRTWQIAMDGSQKLPQRLLGTIRERIAANQSFDRLALGVAAWMRYVMGIDENGDSIDVRDPLAMRMMAIAASAGDDPEAVFDGLVALVEIFGTDLPHSEVFRETVVSHLESLFDIGAKATVEELVD